MNIQNGMNTVTQDQTCVQAQAYAVSKGSTEPVQRTYTISETVLAWISVILGYLFWRIVPVEDCPLGGALFLLFLFIGTAVFLRVKGKRFRALPLCAGIAGIAMALSLFLSANPLIHIFSFLTGLGAFAYFVYGTAGNTLEKGFSDLLPMDILKAVFCMPFHSFGAAVSAIFSKRNKKVGGIVGKVIAGIFLALIPTWIVVSLLSYDSGFTEILSRIFDFDFDFLSIGSHLASFIFGVPVGMYLFGLYISALDGKADTFLSADACHRAAKNIRRLSPVTVLIAVLPILFLYVIFFISQWDYYLAAFFHRLPTDGEALSLYSSYAREGFFQLCTVSGFNLMILSAAALFTRRETKLHIGTLKAIDIAYSVSTLILIATAMAKMKLYIDKLGLTPLRVYSSWFMIILTVIFLLILVKQFVPRLPLLVLSVLVCTFFYCIPILTDVDARIADYNVDRYLSGTLDTVDVDAMRELGDSAVPAMVRLAEALDEKNGTDISGWTGDPDKYLDSSAPLYEQTALYLYWEIRYLDSQSDSIWTATLPALRAKEILNSAGIESKGK